MLNKDRCQGHIQSLAASLDGRRLGQDSLLAMILVALDNQTGFLIGFSYLSFNFSYETWLEYAGSSMYFLVVQFKLKHSTAYKITNLLVI
jgi:hypothetical protein